MKHALALGMGGPQWLHRPDRRSGKTRSSASSASITPSTTGPFNSPLVKAALTSGSLSLLGDVLAQLFTQRSKAHGKRVRYHLDFVRMARMASFGLLFYGPYQYKWYGSLNKRWPGQSLPNFLTKVTLNQIALSPVVLAVVFSWNLALQGQAQKIGPKIKSDLVPTMLNGWKFWVPAASVNFWLIPLQYQVLYMSTAGVLWTGYLSYSSNA